jgi:predicted DNA-binding transcriptional regulator AlpA
MTDTMRLLTLSQVAREIGWSVPTTRKRLEEAGLKPIRTSFNGRRYFVESTVRQWIEQLATANNGQKESN